MYNVTVGRCGKCWEVTLGDLQDLKALIELEEAKTLKEVEYVAEVK